MVGTRKDININIKYIRVSDWVHNKTERVNFFHTVSNKFFVDTRYLKMIQRSVV